MNKLEQLEAATRALPDEYNVIRNTLLSLLEGGYLTQMRAYSLGLSDMAAHLTSDEKLLTPLRTVRELLK